MASAELGVTKSFLYDERGQRWSISDAQLHLGAALTGDALADFAAVNLGWVGIKLNDARIHVRCRPRFMSNTVFSTLCYFLFDNSHQSVALSVMGETWQHFVHTKRDSLVTLLESMQTISQTSGLYMQSQRTRQSSSKLGSQVGVAIGVSRGASSLDHIAYEFDKLFCNKRWTISHIDMATGGVTIDRKGAGFTPFNPHWAAGGSDTPLQTYAGRDYADWIAQTRRYVIETDELVCDDVDATIPFPGIGYSRLTYSRVTAPITLSDGRRFALSAAVSNGAIALKKFA